jgi:hypothetical protein
MDVAEGNATILLWDARRNERQTQRFCLPRELLYYYLDLLCTCM